LRLDAEIRNSWVGEGRKKGRFAEVIQAMIRAHPDAPVAPVLKDGPHGVGGQSIALGKRFHPPFRMTRAKGIAKCGRIQALDSAALP
jgi:hypothetical protein